MPQGDLFEANGVHVLVDGQFGSTGKGVLAAYLAQEAVRRGLHFEVVVSNAGPNSGHTFYDINGEKHVLKQLPTFAVAMYKMGIPIPVVLTAGAIIDPEILRAEAERYPGLTIIVHPSAAVITDEDRASEHSGTIAAVAGTRSGTGAALARKVHRDPNVVASRFFDGAKMPSNVIIPIDACHAMSINAACERGPVFAEVSQGFSLGINQRFYPKCTSRECTVAQALSDASISPRRLAKVYMSCRTYPIRVGNVDGYSSGDWYEDQKEVSWDELGVEAELTTVTKRVRRVATFSNNQFTEAMMVNSPDFVFMNFMNYIKEPHDQERFLASIRNLVGRNVGIIPCYGPTSNDVGAIR